VEDHAPTNTLHKTSSVFSPVLSSISLNVHVAARITSLSSPTIKIAVLEMYAIG